eukprot:CAMPEP_0119332072 /NCGR_PEP_ID=MMETSP1333-20130426/82001_1 /TAXON_ID=418940 /ORGANISM="Scyphosphaera apsteinii, Strain RCC1455" /LENGTH=73 /DNA_ID=CAMNT_0007341819 /DNA_START=9 /DNA_END=228 /DNA_ORIENTATION=-
MAPLADEVDIVDGKFDPCFMSESQDVQYRVSRTTERKCHDHSVLKGTPRHNVPRFYLSSHQSKQCLNARSAVP